MSKTSARGFDLTPWTQAQRQEAAARLSELQRHVLLEHGTERPFCGGLLEGKGPGHYQCALCELPLFEASAKFESGTGWPSFWAPYAPEHVREVIDRSHGMVRTEIRCGRCDGHLGHVFPDGPPPSGLRFCLNSAALEFVPQA